MFYIWAFLVKPEVAREGFMSQLRLKFRALPKRIIQWESC